MIKAVGLFSGGASTLCYLIESCKAGNRLFEQVEFVGAITNHRNEKGIENVVEAGLPKDKIAVVTKKAHGGNLDAWGRTIVRKCNEWGANIVGQYGWSPMTPNIVIDAFEGNIINQHPALVPEFGGLHGMQVHDAVITFMRLYVPDFPWTKAIAQFVSRGRFDEGNIINISPRISIEKDDTPVTLAERVKHFEYDLQVETLEMFATDRVASREPVASLATNSYRQETLVRCKQEAQIRWPKG